MTKLAGLMGFDLYGWQRRLFDIALEHQGAGYAYSIVGLSIGRQQSKTLSLSLRIALELQKAHSRTLYTSTDRGMAVAKWREICGILLESGFAPHIANMRRGIGEEELTCHNGSSFKPVTPSRRAAGRGQSAVTLVIVDEAAQLRDFGPLSALVPTQMVTTSPQLWLASNAGNLPFMDDGGATPWLHYTKIGREAVLDPKADMAWFEWAAHVDGDPEDFDPADRVHWYEALPMLHEGLVTEARVRQLYETMPLAEFTQEVLNLWPSDINVLTIDPGDWAACCHNDIEVDGNDLRMALDVAPNNEAASIAAATYYEDTPMVAVEVIEARAGTSWVVERAVELARKWRPPHITIDASSPAGGFGDQIEAKGIAVERLSGREFAQACDQFLGQVKAQQVAHIDQSVLNEAVVGAVRRTYGDDLWRWSRKSGFVISPLCAVTMACADALVKPKAKVAQVW